MEHRDRTRLLAIIGVLLLVAGIGVAFVGLVEVYCFYLFSEGGRFYYEGFGFGSFMFANIAAQIIGYYLIALVLLPLGYGHLRQRRWARPLALTLLGVWLVVGIPVSLLFLAVLVSSKEPSVLGVLGALILLAGSYLVLPGLLIWFYRSHDVRATFEARDPNTHWLEAVPTPVLVVSALSLFYAVCLHVLLFLNGLFPVFGTWLSGLQGITLLAIAILCLVGLAWTLLGLRMWAWWGAVIAYGLLTLSSILSLVLSSYAELLALMDFPPAEIEFLKGVPLQGVHFALFTGLPLLATLGLLLYARRYFRTGSTKSVSAGAMQ